MPLSYESESALLPPPKKSGGVMSRGFVGLLMTQMFGATNDNIFRWLVIGVGKEMMPNNVGWVLAVGTACFVLPYLLLAAPAGYLADRFSKRKIIVGCKVAEIVIMSLGVAAIWCGSLEMLFVVVALMGSQSALFGPSKLGSIPELLPASKISLANGLIGLTTVGSTAIGMAVGNILSDYLDKPVGAAGSQLHYIREHLPVAAVVLIGVAVVGWGFSLLIDRLPVADPKRRIPWDAPQQTWAELRLLVSHRALFRVALGIAFFWSIGALVQLNIDQFAAEGGATEETDKIALLISLVVGIGVGSVLAGIWSAGRVELGIVPLGALGVACSSALLYLVHGDIIGSSSLWTANYIWACIFLGMLGISAGLFNVPLSAYVQHRSPPERLGSILAASNFFAFGGILLFVGLFFLVRLPVGPNEAPWLSARQVFLGCGLLTVPVFLYVVILVPQSLIRFFVWLASKTIYRIRIYGRGNLPERGGALLIPNHVSWLDGVLLLLSSSRPVRMVTWSGNFQSRLMNRLADAFGAILISNNPKSIARGLKRARQALLDGEIVCIFPEGGITRSGQVQSFKPGMMKILKGTNVPVVPVFLDELWGSIFSFSKKRFFWKLPERIPYPISIHFGEPIENLEDMHTVRQAVQQLGAQAVTRRRDRGMILSREVIRSLKRRKRALKIVDTTGAKVSGGMTLMRSLILRRLLLRDVLAEDEQNVGLLLPPSAGAAITNIALTLMKRVPVNLNYTVNSEVMNDCIERTGIRHILTSRKFMEKMDFDLKAEVVYLDDFREKVTLADKISAGLDAFVLPAWMLDRKLGLASVRPDDVMTIIFTSGSTGAPKGVMLTYANIGHNKDAIHQVIHLSNDVLIGILPFFHSMGFTVTLWTVMALDVKAVYHFSPLDAKVIGRLCEKHGTTVLVATPTFLRSYLRRCTPEQFAKLDVVVAGAEKLPIDLCDAFEKKFGIRPVEGYGVTELSPLVAVNVPPSRTYGSHQIDCKEGTVGRPVPGVSARITDLETGETLGAGQSGMLWVRGPNVMKGYYGQPDKTDEVLHDGWYKTGDVALIDEDGFLKITGRQSRFSKIGGEMVPHIQVEETLAEIIGADEEDGLQAVVTAVPDTKKGERLIVVHRPMEISTDSLCQGLREKGLPNIYIPSPDSFLEIDELPLLGTGKLDLKAIKQMAMDRFAEGGCG